MRMFVMVSFLGAALCTLGCGGDENGSGGSGATGGSGGTGGGDSGGSGGTGGTGAAGGIGGAGGVDGAGATGGGGSGGTDPCAEVDCTSNNKCLQDGACDPGSGECIPGDNVGSGTPCDLSGIDDGICDNGECAEPPQCTSANDCPEVVCTVKDCVLERCTYSPMDGESCEVEPGVPGTCNENVCVGLCEGKNCDDEKECTEDSCDTATGDCVQDNKPQNTACTEDGGSFCDGAGACVECNNSSQCAPGYSCLVPGNVCRDDVLIFRDETFFDFDWTIRMFTWQNGGSGSATQSAEGGNPGEYRHVVTTHNGSNYPNPATGVVAVNVTDQAVYDPATMGEILSIDYSEDALRIVGSQGVGVALCQAGECYAKGVASTGSLTGWQTVQSGLLTADDFQLVVNGVGFDDTMHPDFSSSGAEIQFGFYRSTGCKWGSNTGYPCGAATQEGGIDNWSVTIRHAPAP